MVKLNDSDEVIDIDFNHNEIDKPYYEYSKDIYDYLFQLEKTVCRIQKGFLDNNAIVNARIRAVLVDWLISVHFDCGFLSETLFLCIKLLDEYLQANIISREKFQLLGITCMFMSSKYEETYHTSIEHFVYYADHAYSKEEVRQLEREIIKKNTTILGKPLPILFLRRFCEAVQADFKQLCLAKYLMELTLHDYEFSSYDASYLAACSLALSLTLLKGKNWVHKLEYFSTYKQENLTSGMYELAKLVIKSRGPNFKYKAVETKYSAQNLKINVTKLPELEGNLIRKIALGAYVKE